MQNKPEVQAKIAISLQFACTSGLFCAVQSKSTCREGIFHFFWCTFQGIFMLMNEITCRIEVYYFFECIFYDFLVLMNEITCNEEKCQSI